MPDVIVSAVVDSLLRVASSLAARDVLGTKQNLSVSCATEAEIKAAAQAIEANPSYDRGTIYITANITITDVLGTTLTKDYTFVGVASSALGGLRPQITKGNGPWFTMTGRRLVFSNLRFSITAAHDFITLNTTSYASAYGCDFTQSGGGNTIRRSYDNGIAMDVTNCKVNVTNGSFLWNGAGNPADTNNPQFALSFVGCDLAGRLLSVVNAGKGRVVLVNSRLVDNGQGCWYATEFAAGRTDVEVQYSGDDAVSLALGAGSTEPITFTNLARLATQSTAVSAAITAERNVRFTGSTPGQVLTLPAAVDGRERWVYNMASVPVDVARNATPGTDTINGGAGPLTIPAGESRRFVCFGTDWNT